MKRLPTIICTLCLAFPLNAQTDKNSVPDALRDGNGWYNVKSYGAAGDGVTNDTEAVQNAVDAAGNGTVFFPPGNYLVDSINVGYGTGSTRTPNLRGAGSVSYGSGQTSHLIAALNKPVLTIDIDVGYPEGGIIEGLYITGSNSPYFTNQHGIVFQGPADYMVRDCYIYQMGGWGIKFDTDLGHIHNHVISHVKCQENHLGGIYGVGISSGNQLNAIRIEKCHLINNHGFGIWIWGTSIQILYNIIENNGNTGIYIGSTGVLASNTFSSGIIQGNHFEFNGGGDIYLETGYDGSYAHVIRGLEISNNYFLNGSASVVKPEVDACITLAREPGSRNIYYYRDFKLGKNTIANKGTLAKFDGRHAIDRNAVITLDYNSDIGADWIGLGTATIEWKGARQNGWATISAVDARTGITSSMLNPAMYCSQNEAVEISANPQIVAGHFDGQEIMIMGNSDTNTLSFEDGKGLSLGAKRVLGRRDILKLKWFEQGAVWEEIYFNDK